MRTTNHDEIREWITERGGMPAMVRNTTTEESVGEITIKFGENDEVIPITWREFFAIFDSSNMQFRCDTKVSSEDAPWAFSIEGKNISPDTSAETEETEFPEDTGFMLENVYSSQRGSNDEGA